MKNQLKSAYVQTCLDRYGNDPKKLWRSIRSFWPNSKSKSTTIKSINGNTGEGLISEILNEHFCNVGSNVQSRITGNATLDEFPFAAKPPIFDLNPVSLEDIIEAINRLKSSQSCGIDGITSNILESAKLEISPILYYLFNRSINSKTFPECWKLATVTPLFKGGIADNCDNY